MLSCSVAVKFVGIFVVIFVGCRTIADLWEILGDLSRPVVFSLFCISWHISINFLCGNRVTLLSISWPAPYVWSPYRRCCTWQSFISIWLFYVIVDQVTDFTVQRSRLVLKEITFTMVVLHEVNLYCLLCTKIGMVFWISPFIYRSRVRRNFNVKELGHEWSLFALSWSPLPGRNGRRPTANYYVRSQGRKQ